MHTLASIDVLDLNKPAAPAAHGVDGVHAKAATANEPRHHDLSHYSAPNSRFHAGYVQRDLDCVLLLFCISVGSHNLQWRRNKQTAIIW
jgi:hypothetical protein